MPTLIDLSGTVFGRLTVLSRSRNSKDNKPQWLCECHCGEQKVIRGSDLKTGRTKSCGCLRSIPYARTHGMSNSQIYHVWKAMHQRCSNPNNKSFPNYGGRGISVCDRWSGKTGFAKFFHDMGHPAFKGATLDRINNSGHYSPENCRWADRQTQSHNSRKVRMITIDGESKSLSAWISEASVSRTTVYKRLNEGWGAKDALFTPVK